MKRLYLLSIIMLGLMWLVTQRADAQNNASIWDGTSEFWTQGSGTESNPYLIQNARQLACLAEFVNAGNSYDNTYFRLTTDVYIDSTIAWQPIGISNTFYFGGHFDGNNHTVTLYLVTPDLPYSGLFGYAKNGSISNLTSAGLVRRTGTGDAYAGGICGYSASSFNNCHNSANVSSSSLTGTAKPYSGGLCGYSTASFLNCHNTGSISSSYYAGGICGYSTSTFTNCHNTGFVIASNTSNSNGNHYYSYAGGICGYSTAPFAFPNSYNTGEIASSSSPPYSNHTAGNTNYYYYTYSYAGGICGVGNNITNCYNKGDILASDPNSSGHFASSYAGGICGNGSSITKCYNSGDISSSGSNSSSHPSCAGGICGLGGPVSNCYNIGNISSNLYSGGICGKATLSIKTIKNCYNVGSLLSGTSKGGICGSGGNITNCYYLETCGHSASTGGVAKTEAMMKSVSFPAILNVDSVSFVMDIMPHLNQGYPVFGSVATQDADNVGVTTATLHGSYQLHYEVDAVCFEYKKSSESNYTTVNATDAFPVSYNVMGLQEGTEYTYRFFVQKNGIVYRGADVTFNTAQCTLDGSVVSSSNTLCEGTTVDYTITPTSNNSTSYQYVWNTGDLTNAIPVTDDATYTVTVTDNLGCSIVRSKQMNLSPAAVASITGHLVVCSNHNTSLTANGGVYYSWNTGSAQKTITVSQPGTYIATVQNVYGCTASDTVEVVAFTDPVINGNSVFCPGNHTTLTVVGSGTYLWSTGATTTSIDVYTAGNYSVTASTSNGCSGSASVTVVQDQNNNVTISGNTVICSGIGTSLTASSGASYYWSTGQTSQSISVNNPGTYTVTVTNSNGCSYFATQSVTLMEQATISGTNHICVGQSTTLTAIGSGSYAWSNGANTSSITVNTSGDYTVTVSLPNGCSSSATVNVVSHPLPTISISGDTYLCVGESNLLTASGGNTYLWSNGTTAPSISVNHGGTYSVTGTTTYGCSNSDSVTVVSLENLSISGNTHICSGQSTTLSAVNGTGSYAWSTGSNSQSVTVTDPGTYTVTVTLPNGCSSAVSTVVTTALLPTPSIVGSTSICQGQSTMLTATGGNTYVWSTGSTTDHIDVSQTGVYTVTATNSEGCSAATNVAVTVNPLPAVSINGITSFCQGQSTTLTANGGVVYAWNNGDFTPSVTISQGGVYTVTATNAAGCSSTAEATVTVKPLPDVHISGNSSFCQGDTSTLTATGASTYVWSNNSSSGSIAVSSPGGYTVLGTDANDCSNSATMYVSVNSTYYISLAQSICQGEVYNFHGMNLYAAGVYTQTLQTVNGCDSIVTLTLTVKASPTLSISGNTMLCEGQSTTLTANGGNTYLWSNGSTNASVIISQSGIYTVTATNTEGCSSSANVSVVVSSLPNVSIIGDDNFCQGGSMTLIANGASSYMWSDGSNTAAITVTNPGVFTVIGTDANGCSSSASKTISVNPSYHIQLAASICQGGGYSFNGQYLTSAGTYTQTFSTVNGCDSIITLTLTIIDFPAPTITGNTILCEGQSTTLTANGGNTYLWSNGSANASTTVFQSGIYSVTATSAEGCSSMANVTVSMSPLPTISISGNTTFCEGSSTTLIASGADTYSWSNGANTAAVTISSFGLYTVTGVSAYGCSNTATVTVLSLASPQITIAGETDICAGESTTLTANGGESYLWSDGTTGNTITVSTAGTYQVIGYNAAGCNAMASATVNVWQPATSEFSIVTEEPCYSWNNIDYCTSGDYTQTLQTIHGCDSIVTLHLTITVGIDDHNLGASMTVYPNPTNDIVKVQCTMNNVQAGTMEFHVFDAFGRWLRSTDGVETQNFASLQTDTHGPSVQTQIDLSRFAPGVYFVKAVADGNVVAVRKVVKN